MMAGTGGRPARTGRGGLAMVGGSATTLGRAGLRGREPVGCAGVVGAVVLSVPAGSDASGLAPTSPGHARQALEDPLIGHGLHGRSVTPVPAPAAETALCSPCHRQSHRT